MLKRLIVFVFVFMLIGCFYSNVFAGNNNEAVILNSYFSFKIPKELKGIYSIEKADNGIYILEKVSEKSGVGGFAFGFKIFKGPNDYVSMPGYRKIGELTDKKGKLYDMVLVRPSEIQYVDRKDVKENYEKLYELGDRIELKGINGSIYIKDKGMKGEDLYGEILKKYKTAIEQNWPLSKYEEEKMGYMYASLPNSKKPLLERIGYTYYDLNNDGIDELFIGEIKKGNSKGVIYDIYTMVDRKPKHVISGGGKDKFFVCSEYFIWNEFIESPNESSIGILYLQKNKDELDPWTVFIYSIENNKKNPYFISTGIKGDLKNVSKKEYNKQKKNYTDYKRFDYTPLSEFNSK